MCSFSYYYTFRVDSSSFYTFCVIYFCITHIVLYYHHKF
nr:MAG TPA: hypothetical protein [Caudoviricetes sp.]